MGAPAPHRARGPGGCQVTAKPALCDLHVGVVSAGRSPRVPDMTVHLAPLAPTWYVPVGQGAEYRRCGARQVVEVAGNLSDQRNAVLEAAFAEGRWAVEVNDDFVKAIWRDRTPASLAEGIGSIVAAMVKVDAHFGGAASTPNPYFARQDLSLAHFILAQLMVFRPNPLRFDTRMRLKEDYDMTLQHLDYYGLVARVDRFLPTFRHNERKGGCGPYRTPEEEDRHVAMLLAKWPGKVVPNPRRPHEVLIRWR